MGIKKQEFYEGAALYLLARAGTIEGIRYMPPFFLLNGRLSIYLKYSARVRSPWGFTFMPEERAQLRVRAVHSKVIIGLICGGDGVVALNYERLCDLFQNRNSAVHVSCFRGHGEFYEVNGPDGQLGEKIAPSDWRKILGG